MKKNVSAELRLRIPLLMLPLVGLAFGAPAFAQAPPAASADAPSGPLRASDTVGVQVVGEPSLSGPFTFAANGTLTLPLVGSVKVLGLTPSRAGEVIAAAYRQKKLLRNPQVVVTILRRPERTVSIAGALERQARVTLGEGTRLNEVLEPAGILPASDLSKVIVTRGDRQLVVDYLAFRTGGDAPDGLGNPLLEDGDKIYVRARIQVAGTVKINGEVRNPTVTSLVSKTTVFQAIQGAGGVTELADREKIVITRGGVEIPVPYKAIQEGQTEKDIVLQDKDEIFVRKMEKPKLFFVTGGVARSSSFPIAGNVTLNEAIAAAGGTLPRVDLKKISIQRKSADGQIETKVYDLTLATDLAVAILPEDVVAVPFPKGQKTNILSALGSLSGLLFLFRR
jgi:protein involved in polysaccharide export with SLBB domain